MVQGQAGASTLQIDPARRLAGRIRVPGDKSISHRYVMLGAVARGKTTISHLAPGADVAATVDCFRRLGVSVEAVGVDAVCIHGEGWSGLSRAHAALDARNSGTTLRLMAGLLAGRPLTTTISGDESLSRRPMRRVIDPLEAMGATIDSTGGRAPLTIRGTELRAVEWPSPVPSAQVKSAIMLAGLSARGTTSITEPLPTRDHTERAFPAFGLDSRTEGLRVLVPGDQEAIAPPTSLHVPGDPSSAAVWACAAAALPGSDVTLERVGLNSRRIGFVRALRQLGAAIDLTDQGSTDGEPVGEIRVRHAGRGHCEIVADEVPDLIDELPVLAACAALGGSLAVSGASELRVKESDRITALVVGLRSLGVAAEERDDGFVIAGDRVPRGGHVDAGGDHRLVMAFTIVALGAAGPSVITGAEAVAVSYPAFPTHLGALAS